MNVDVSGLDAAAALRAARRDQALWVPDKPPTRLSGMTAWYQASPTVSNMQAAIASCGDLAPRTRKSKAG